MLIKTRASETMRTRSRSSFPEPIAGDARRKQSQEVRNANLEIDRSRDLTVRQVTDSESMQGAAGLPRRQKEPKQEQ
jgi:hypothetical protein